MVHSMYIGDIGSIRWASDELFVPWARKPPVAEFCWVWSLECWVAWQLKDREPWPMIHQVWICSNLNTYIFPSSRKCYLCLCPICVWFEIYLMANVYCFSLLTWVFSKQFVNQVMFEGGKRWLPKTPKRLLADCVFPPCSPNIGNQFWAGEFGDEFLAYKLTSRNCIDNSDAHPVSSICHALSSVREDQWEVTR